MQKESWTPVFHIVFIFLFPFAKFPWVKQIWEFWKGHTLVSKAQVLRKLAGFVYSSYSVLDNLEILTLGTLDIEVLFVVLHNL